MSDPVRFNHYELVAKLVTDEHVTELTRIAQERFGLEVDGKCGPKTRAALEASAAKRATPAAQTSLGITVSGWLQGDRVRRIPADPSWFYRRLATKSGQPEAIVAHYTATDPGTAIVMANHRTTPIKPGDRAASWHVSIEADGSLVQMIPFLAGAWHCSKPIPGRGAANRCSVGIELVGHGEAFPEAQVASARAVWRALVQTYPITRQRAMYQHSELDPERRSDPGPVWMSAHAQGVLEHAFA